MTEQLNRDIAVAEGLVSAMHENGRNSILTVFVEMYRLHKLGGTPLNVASVFMLGNFMHGTIASSAIQGALDTGHITKEKPEGAKYALLHPTEKLIALVQAIIEVEAFPWKTLQGHKKRGESFQRGMQHFEAQRSELERDHLGKRIAMSVNTGRYIVNDGNDDKMQEFAGSLEPGDLIWMTTVTPRQASQ